MTDFSGRRAIVFGGGTPIGAACASALAETGGEVLVVDPDRELAERVTASLAGSATALVADLVSTDGAEHVRRWADKTWGSVDVLVDCTSAMELWPVEDDSMERLTEVLATNVMGPLLHTESLRPLLVRSGAAAIVYLGSIDGLRANPQVPAYSTGKAGVAVLTHAMAARLGVDGIRVNCVAAAGILQTPTSAGPVRRPVGDLALAVRLTPLGRMPVVEEIASVVAFLASPAASYVSGAVIPVDGGRIAATPGTW